MKPTIDHEEWEGYHIRPAGLTLEERLAADARELEEQTLVGLLLHSRTVQHAMTFVVAVACGVLIGGIVIGFWRR